MENLPQLDESRARDAAGRSVGVSGKSVDFATKVLANADPEVIKTVDSGHMSVSAAAKLSTEPPEVQREVAANPKGKRPTRSPKKRSPKKRDAATDERVGPDGTRSAVLRAFIAITNELKALCEDARVECLQKVLSMFPLPK